ncbi:MAG: cation diffusion facilitator family transporter [Acidimicrobiia bacterium]|nr:cation diffusion facilitator family transporter [bacterium]MYB78143.1 cation diffusion facilitator family transporter [Acidimicrobiia bacterium]
MERHSHDHPHGRGHDHSGGHDHPDGHRHDSSHGHGHGHGHEHGSGSLWSGFKHGVSELLGTHSHDHAESIDSAIESSKRGVRALVISFTGLMVTAVLQAVIVFFTGSVALIADTIHNFSDALTAVPLFIAFKLGRRAATSRYTYGYRRAEDVAGLFIVLMILLSAIIAIWESVERLFNPRELDYLGILFAAGVIGFLGNELVAIYRIRVGRQIGSAALVADGRHARADGFTSLAVAAGAVGVWLGFERADPIVGIIVGIVILRILWSAARDIYWRLMDAVDPEMVKEVESVTNSIEEVLGVNSCQVRWMGHRLRADVSIGVDSRLSVGEGHSVGEMVQQSLQRQVRHLDEAFVHVDATDRVQFRKSDRFDGKIDASSPNAASPANPTHPMVEQGGSDA